MLLADLIMILLSTGLGFTVGRLNRKQAVRKVNSAILPLVHEVRKTVLLAPDASDLEVRIAHDLLAVKLNDYEQKALDR